ncbi:nucleoside diphosphate kinase III, chloroplastic/mitochondrial [Tanacetum coccineum]
MLPLIKGFSKISRDPKEIDLLMLHQHSVRNRLWVRIQLRSAATMLNLFNLRRLAWPADKDGQQKVVLSNTEVESLRSELSDLEEREAHLKARLEHIDEILRSARLSGYLQLRTRWAALPGEPAPIDNTEVDDWLPRFVVLQGQCIYLYFNSTGGCRGDSRRLIASIIKVGADGEPKGLYADICIIYQHISPQDSTLLSDVVEVGRMPCLSQEGEEIRYCFYIVTRSGLRYECSSASKLQMHPLSTSQEFHIVTNGHLVQSASRTARSLLSSASKHRHYIASEGRTAAAAATVSVKGAWPAIAAFGDSTNTSSQWIAGALALPAAAYMLQDQEAHALQMERTFIAIKPDGVQRGLISEIISRFERKGYKLVAIKLVVPSKSFAGKHYNDLKDRPFFNGLCNFLSSGPVLAMVWEGEGVITYGRKLIGATDPQKSEPGTIRGDLAIVVGRNIIHGSDGPETAKNEINLWFKPEELTSYTSNQEKWAYGVN